MESLSLKRAEESPRRSRGGAERRIKRLHCSHLIPAEALTKGFHRTRKRPRLRSRGRDGILESKRAEESPRRSRGGAERRIKRLHCSHLIPAEALTKGFHRTRKRPRLRSRGRDGILESKRAEESPRRSRGGAERRIKRLQSSHLIPAEALTKGFHRTRKRPRLRSRGRDGILESKKAEESRGIKYWSKQANCDIIML